MYQFSLSTHKFFVLLLACFSTAIATQSQTNQNPQPKWWLGASAAANFNTFRGTTQMLNENFTTPTAFHKGNGVKPYLSILTEYRPNKVWGGMLNVAFDNRGGKFKEVMAPCDCPANLSTNISFVSVEPSVRLAPFSSSFYVFAGPVLGFNLAKTFTYTQDKQPDRRAEWSNVRKTIFSAQVGAGIDLPISAPSNTTQMSLSPFLSFQTDIGHEPRSIESWSFYTIRAGVAFKFGKVKKSSPVTTIPEPEVIEKEVEFSVRAPKIVPVKRKVKETIALRNSVFFDMGSTTIPSRYVSLSTPEAATFREEQLQTGQPDNLNNGRSSRQLAVYHNILNIMGDRMRTHPQSTITLSGAADKNPSEGKLLADNIKQYLVTVFGIDAARIKTEGRDKPLIPSEQPGGTKELDLLRAGDRRVDIVSTSPELLLQVGGNTASDLKPVQIIALQEDPLDSHVIFTAAGANELLSTWSVEISDEKGNVQKYGPFTKDQASVSGKTILGNNDQGNYHIVMVGQKKSGAYVRKESEISIKKTEDTKQEGLRYSILFDFDKSKSIASYEKFLTEIVSPLIPENGMVMIHGHTDVIGDEKYNMALSYERAKGVQQIIERALLQSGKRGVTFETYGFGKDAMMAPFENNLPEERFYNRTVIIDIIPAE